VAEENCKSDDEGLRELSQSGGVNLKYHVKACAHGLVSCLWNIIVVVLVTIVTPHVGPLMILRRLAIALQCETYSFLLPLIEERQQGNGGSWFTLRETEPSFKVFFCFSRNDVFRVVFN
jgi:hypothetical protein